MYYVLLGYVYDQMLFYNKFIYLNDPHGVNRKVVELKRLSLQIRIK